MWRRRLQVTQTVLCNDISRRDYKWNLGLIWIFSRCAICLLVSLPFKSWAVAVDCRTFVHVNFLFLSVQWLSNRFQDNLWAFSSVPTDGLQHPSNSQIFPRICKSPIFNEHKQSNAFSLEWMVWVSSLNTNTIHSLKKRVYHKILAMGMASEIYWSIVLSFMKCLINN